jgi:TldD protein
VKVPCSPYLAARRGAFRRLVRELGREFAYVSLLATDSRGTRYEVRRGQLSVQESRWSERGCVARAHDGTAYTEVSFNLPPDPGLAERLARSLRPRPGAGPAAGLEQILCPVPRETPLKRRWQGRVEVLPEAMSVEQKLARLAALRDRAFGLCPALVDIRLVYEEVTVRKLFLSRRRELEQAYHWGQGYLIPVVRRGEDARPMHRSFSGLKGVELLEELERGLGLVLKNAEELLDARHVVPGLHEVILAPEVAGLLAHEAFGHGVEMDMFVKGRARAAQYLGRPVGSERVTMHDGARAAQQVGSFWFDDEGTLGTDTRIIERGLFHTGISDLLSALRLGTEPTGNGVRESFERKAYARMTNTFFAPGPDRLQDMIASIPHGYLLERYVSGMEDPRNWGLQGVIIYGREIVDGKLTGAVVSPVIMTGYVPDVLSSISMAGGELELSGSGMCGKGHKEYVKNSSGGPYVKCRLRLG